MSANPRFELDPDPSPTRSLPPGPVTAVLVLVGGSLIGGPFGAAIAVLALLVWRRYPKWLGGLAAGLLGLTVLASVLGDWPNQDSLRQSFADDRRLAAAAGLAAGVSLLVMVARAAREDRAPGPAATAPETTTLSAAELLTRAGPWLPYGAVVLLAAGVSLWLAPDALPASQHAAADALRAGQGFVRISRGEVAPTAFYAPAPLVVASLFPSSTGTILTMLTALTASATMVLGFRLGGRRPALLAGLFAALLPMTWDQRLPGALAALAVTTALLLSWPDRITVARAVAAGAALAVACLARPETLVLLPVVVAWVILWPSSAADRSRSIIAAAVIAGVTLLGIAPWVLHVHRTFHTLWPTMQAWPNEPLEGLVRGITFFVAAAVLGMALDEAWWRRSTIRQTWRRHLPWVAVPALAAFTALVTLGDRNLWFALGPIVAIGAAASFNRHLIARVPTDPSRQGKPVPS